MRSNRPDFCHAVENFRRLPSACTTAGCPPVNLDYSDIRKFSRVFYHDVRFSWDLTNLGGIGNSFQFYAGVDNLLDRKPPLGSTATGAGSAIYDVRGRSVYAGVRARF